MTHFEPGDIILIPFPFTDFSTVKQRPCVVLSSGKFNRTRPDIIVAAITSRVDEDAAYDEYVLKESEQRKGGLPKVSKVKAGKIVTVDQRLIRSTLGRLPAAAVHRIRKLVHKII